MKTSLILLPHQLYPLNELPQVDAVIMVEDPVSFGVDQNKRQLLHKQKLILLRAAMRRYAEEVLWPAGVKVEYIELDVLLSAHDLLDKLKKFERSYMFEPTDTSMSDNLLQARREQGENAPVIEFLPSPNFYLKEHEVRQYFGSRHKHVFDEFYQWQRERFNILIEDFKPVGNAWQLATKETALKAPLPSFAVFGDNKWVEDARKFVDKHFSDNPGSSDCIWPTSHAEAAQWLDDFVRHRIDGYAEHANQIMSDAPWLYHSALSASLNIGLLSPRQVVETVLARHRTQPIPLTSLELFIRQVLGHREFIRGLYLTAPDLSSNPLKNSRHMTPEWYSGALGIPAFDDIVAKLQSRAYAHNSERLLVAGTLMTICEISPSDMHQWFKELFIDAYDWSIEPYVYLLSTFAEESSIDAGPFFVNAKTIIDVSDYERGEWANVWDGLYWRFVEKHRAYLSKHAKMRSVLSRLDRLDPDQKRIIYYRAEDFLNRFTR